MDLGERIAETVVREVREETGLSVEVTGIVGIYSDPGHVIAYSDGEVRQEFNVCFAVRLLGGRLSVSDESTEVRWVAPREIEELPLHESIRLRIKHFLEHRTTPAIA
jgi:ADP-ribose pyrophosphatase YjhB (NUDIX family)